MLFWSLQAAPQSQLIEGRNMRYIIICEDGAVYKADKVTESDFNASNDGILLIIDPKNMVIHEGPENDSWAELTEWEHGGE